ncbi:transposable element Tcb1 transposase [Trichonephila clavipes]|nr:transposable element Tcb1 transposase [Trichonephila clavipes]
MEAGWSARRVAYQLGRSVCVVRRCWEHCIRKISFTRRPGSGRLRQTSHREYGHIVRNARTQSTALSAAFQAQVASSLGAHVSSRTIRWRLAEGHLGSWRPLRVLPLTPTHRRFRLERCCARGNWTAAEWIQVVFNDESRFNLSSDDNRVRVWRPRDERLNPAFALQRHTAPTACLMVWGAIAYNTRSPLVLIRGTMTAQWYVHDILQPHVLPLMQLLSGALSTRQCSASNGKGVTKLSPNSYYPSLACPIPIFVSNRAYLGSFGTACWASHEYERTRCKVTSNMERNVSRHHTKLVCLNA